MEEFIERFNKIKENEDDDSEKTEDLEPNELIDDEEEEDEESEEEKDDVNWMKTAGIVIGINIVLILAGFFLFKFFKKRAADAQAQLLARLE